MRKGEKTEKVEWAPFRRRYAGADKCCKKCFASLVCITGTEKAPIFRCRHCNELNVLVVDIPPGGVGRRARSRKVPEACPLGMTSSPLLSNPDYCDACQEAIDGFYIEDRRERWER
jgi:hypothetical protein